MTVSTISNTPYRLDISPALEESTVKPICFDCRFTSKDTINNRICPSCFPESWIPFTSIILSYHINLKAEHLVVAEISAFVVTYMKNNNIHLGINRQCPRSKMATPAIPLEFVFDFLSNFDMSIVGMPKSPMTHLAESRLVCQNSFYLYLRIVSEKYPHECAILPFKISKLVLEYCYHSNFPLAKNEQLTPKDHKDFLLYFDEGFFSTSPELKILSSVPAFDERSSRQKHSVVEAIENDYSENSQDSIRYRPAKQTFRKPRESRYIWQLGENLFLFREDQCSFCFKWIPTEWQKANHSFSSWELVAKSLIHPDVDFTKVRMNDKIIAQLCSDGELYVPNGIKRPKLNHLNKSPAWGKHCTVCTTPMQFLLNGDGKS